MHACFIIEENKFIKHAEDYWFNQSQIIHFSWAPSVRKEKV